MDLNLKISEEIDNEYNSILGLDNTNDVSVPIYKSNKINKGKKDTLVLSGGGVNGISLIGSLKALEIENMLDDITTFAGTSIGALIISMFIIGYSPDKLFNIVKLLDFEKLNNLTITNLIKGYGLDTGIKLEYIVKKLLTAKGFKEDINLLDLYKKTNKKLIITTVCLNKMETCYISHETYPDIPLYIAIRMSTSIPILYTPVNYKGYLYVDGGCIDNYPIHMFRERLDHVIGIFVTGDTNVFKNINNIETYIIQIVKCLNFGFNLQTFKGYENNTLLININNIGSINFNITEENKKNMFNKGFSETLKYITNK